MGQHDLPRNYLYTSPYFVCNLVLLLVYPICRLLFGLENNAKTLVA